MKALLLLLLLAPLATHAQQPTGAVSGAGGVRLDAVDSVHPVDPVHPVQTVTKVDGVNKIDGVRTTGQVAPASIQAIQGVGGIDTARLQNLEAAIQLKQGATTPAGTGAELGGKGKSAAAALLSAPLQKAPPKTGPKEDGRAGFQEFEKLQTRGS